MKQRHETQRVSRISARVLIAFYRITMDCGAWKSLSEFRMQKHDLKQGRFFTGMSHASGNLFYSILLCSPSCVSSADAVSAALTENHMQRAVACTDQFVSAHTQTDAVYAMPSTVSHHASKIHRVVGLESTTTACQVK